MLGFDPDPARVAGSIEGVELFQTEDELGTADVWVVCVPTPLRDGRPDLSAVRAAVRTIGRHFAPGNLVILESTSYPGTTREVVLPELLEAARAEGFDPTLGVDLFVAYSPERMDPGRAVPPLAAIPKVVGGLDEASGDVAARFYATVFDEVVPVGSAEVAEAAKLLENMYRSVNIALINEVKTVLAAMDIDPHEVVATAATKPFGFEAFTPGPGPGGHCIPVDPAYFQARARRLGVETPLLSAAESVHQSMPAWVVEQMTSGLARRGVELEQANVLVLGVAYKRDIADTRESPAFPILALLIEAGAHTAYADPFVPDLEGTAGEALALEAVTPTRARIESADVVLLLTDHTAWNLPQLAEHARLIVDTRNAFAAFAAELGERLVRA